MAVEIPPPGRGKRVRALVVAGAGVLLAGSLAVAGHATLGHSAQRSGGGGTGAAATTTSRGSATSVPRRLRIPAIGVDAAVEGVGVTASGAMGVPERADDVGWLAIGVHPGQPGDSVMDAPLVWSNGPGVFAKLGQVKVGDVAEVDYTDGKVRRFKVIKNATYPWSDSPPGLFATGGAPRLSLVTCTSTWDGRIFGPRIVIETAPVS